MSWGQADAAIPTLSSLGAQPLDSDLTAIAALATTAYGRALLALADAVALAALLAAPVVSLDQTAPPTDGTLQTATGTRTVFGSLNLGAAVADSAGMLIEVETGVATAVYRTVMQPTIGLGAIVADVIPFAFTVPKGARYRFTAQISGAATASIARYSYSDA